MKFKYRMTVLDAVDIDAEATFWAGLLDGSVEPTDGDRWRNVWIDSNWQLGVQQADEYTPPTWPDPRIPQQIHFDLYVEGVDALYPVEAEILELGGRVLRPAPDRERPSGCQVFASPAGHSFCVCWLPPQ
jgi:hypothetical protein